MLHSNNYQAANVTHEEITVTRQGHSGCWIISSQSHAAEAQAQYIRGRIEVRIEGSLWGTYSAPDYTSLEEAALAAIEQYIG
jgi:hypothetical protein